MKTKPKKRSKTGARRQIRQPKTYYDCRNNYARVQVHQGGTRSGKTYSILQVLIELCYRYPNRGTVITICRKSFPSLRGSVMRDFFEILKRLEWYSEANHNKSEHTYNLFGNLIEFISIDQPQKVRGRKRDFLFANEANELTLEDWRQLMYRTKVMAIIDYNPSDEFHWIYEEVIPRNDALFFKSTYLDNPHLDPAVVREIEQLKEVDENHWRVYGLGERGQSRETVFTHYLIVDEIPEGYKLRVIGIDFGFTNNPTAIVECWSDGKGWYFKVIAYKHEMRAKEIAEAVESYRVPVVADSAEPRTIDQIRGHSINIHKSIKGPDSVRTGIEYLKGRPMYIDSNSPELIKEVRNYKFQVNKEGRVLNEPVKAFDHAIDACRYGAGWFQKRPNFGEYAIG